MLQAGTEKLPLKIEDVKVLETEHAPSTWPDFLGHLPPATAPTLVEICMKKLVTPEVYKKFESRLKNRDNRRNAKAAKEKKYT